MLRDDILIKMQRYCDYQERCHQEVRSKLIRMQVYGEELEQIMAILIEEDLLNEERFARSFARGRHRIKAWGRHRITRELKKRQISDYCIRKGNGGDRGGGIPRRTWMHGPAAQKDNLSGAPDWPPGQEQEEDLREHAMRKGYELPSLIICGHSRKCWIEQPVIQPTNAGFDTGLSVVRRTLTLLYTRQAMDTALINRPTTMIARSPQARPPNPGRLVYSSPFIECPLSRGAGELHTPCI